MILTYTNVKLVTTITTTTTIHIFFIINIMQIFSKDMIKMDSKGIYNVRTDTTVFNIDY